MNRKIRRRVFHTFEREFAIPAVQTTVDVGDGLTIADNAAGLVLLAGVGLHDAALLSFVNGTVLVIASRAAAKTRARSLSLCTIIATPPDRRGHAGTANTHQVPAAGPRTRQAPRRRATHQDWSAARPRCR